MQLVNHLDEQAIRRKRELTTIWIASGGVQRNEASSRALRRAGYCLAYAHYEGFIVDAARRYLDHVALQGNSFQRLSPDLKVNALHSRLRGLAQSDRHWQFREVVDLLLGHGTATVSNSMIDAQSNLSSVVLTDILSCCGISSAQFETRQRYIDQTLLQTRNDIAHGKLVDVEASDLREAKEFAISTIDLLNAEFQNAATLRSYLN